MGFVRFGLILDCNLNVLHLPNQTTDRANQFFKLGCRVGQAQRRPTRRFPRSLVGLRKLVPPYIGKLIGPETTDPFSPSLTPGVLSPCFTSLVSSMMPTELRPE